MKPEKLRCGVTTGTCAALAAAGAARQLLSGRLPQTMTLITPEGPAVTARLYAQPAAPGEGCCGVIKDAGDDIDVTHRALIIARVRRQREPGVTIEGGRGVGRVTRPGLDQPPGAAAINRGPRRQIAQAVQAECRAAGAAGGMHVLIEIPEGERLARKTFNPKLGIVGGLSVLGTGGIVHPRSRRAVRETVTLEIGQAAALGAGRLALCPGNVGRDFARRVPGLKHWPTVVCSNFVGAAVDAAAEGGIPTLLLTGSLGKLIKVAGGSWDTHSAVSGGRMETLAALAAAAGAGRGTVRALLACATTDEGLARLAPPLRRRTLALLLARLDGHLRARAGDGCAIGAVVCTGRGAWLGASPGAKTILERQAGV